MVITWYPSTYHCIPFFHAKDAAVGIQDALFYMNVAVTGLQDISD